MAQRVEVAPGFSQAQHTQHTQHTHPATGPGPVRVRTRRDAFIALAVPAHKDYVVIIRSAVAQLGACFGFTVRDLTDLRLAVNEACALLVAACAADAGPAFQTAHGSDADAIECRAEVRGDLLRVTVAAPAGGFDAPDTDSLGWTMMAALVDKLIWAHDGVTARVALEKRRGTPDG